MRHAARSFVVAALAVAAVPSHADAQACVVRSLSAYLSPSSGCSVGGYRFSSFIGFGTGPTELPSANVIVTPLLRVEAEGTWVGFNLSAPGTVFATSSTSYDIRRAGLIGVLSPQSNLLNAFVGGVSSELYGGRLTASSGADVSVSGLVSVQGVGADGLRRIFEQSDNLSPQGSTIGDQTRIYDYPNNQFRSVLSAPGAGDYYAVPDIDLTRGVLVYFVAAAQGQVRTGSANLGFDGSRGEIFIRRSSVPEPSSFYLLSAGMLLLSAAIARRKRA